MSLLSCIQDYDMDFSLVEKMLTLNADIVAGKRIEALIAVPKKADAYGDYITPRDAEVVVYEDGEVFEKLQFEANDDAQGIYVSEKRVQEGKEYKIEVYHPDFPDLVALQKVPIAPHVLETTINKNHSDLVEGDTVLVEVRLQSFDNNISHYAINSFLYVSWYSLDSSGNMQYTQ